MFSPKHFRDKAAKYSERAKTANGPNVAHELERLEKHFAALADNEQWLLDNYNHTLRTLSPDVPIVEALADKEDLAKQEEHVLRCLGAALIMQ